VKVDADDRLRTEALLRESEDKRRVEASIEDAIRTAPRETLERGAEEKACDETSKNDAEEKKRKEVLKREEALQNDFVKKLREQALKRNAEEKSKSDQAKLDVFLKRNKYSGVNDMKKTLMRSKYPLHTAVKHRDVDMVRILLEAGADPRLTDSNSWTPLDLAHKLKHGTADKSLTIIVNSLPMEH